MLFWAQGERGAKALRENKEAGFVKRNPEGTDRDCWDPEAGDAGGAPLREAGSPGPAAHSSVLLSDHHTCLSSSVSTDSIYSGNTEASGIVRDLYASFSASFQEA